MLLLLLLVFSVSAATQQEWSWNVYPESGFKVFVPFNLTHKSSELPTPSGTLTYHQYTGGSVSGGPLNMAIVIDHYTYPDEEIGGDQAHLEEFFSSTVDQILESVGGELVYQDITAHSGRDVCVWKGSFEKGKGVIKGELIIINDKYYGLQVFGLKSPELEADTQKFLDSFQVISNQKKD